MTNWKLLYRGWTITHDPEGKLACYRNEGSTLEWCYFGSTVDSLKAEIDYREAHWSDFYENQCAAMEG